MFSCSVVSDPTHCSMPDFPVLHYLLEFAQIHVHRGNQVKMRSFGWVLIQHDCDLIKRGIWTHKHAYNTHTHTHTHTGRRLREGGRETFTSQEMPKITDFPGGPVVKTLPPNAEGVGSIPGWGAKIPHASLDKKIKHKKKYCFFFFLPGCLKITCHCE